MSPGCRRARFLPKSDPAAPFFVLHRPAQRMGAIGAGDRCSLWLLRPGAVLQRCHIGAASVPQWCWERASMVLECRKRGLSLAACRQGAMTEPYVCSLGALVVLPCPVPFATCVSSRCRERAVWVPPRGRVGSSRCQLRAAKEQFGVTMVLEWSVNQVDDDSTAGSNGLIRLKPGQTGFSLVRLAYTVFNCRRCHGT